MAVSLNTLQPDALPQTRSAWAAQRLRSAILLAELAPGDEIREARLAREWGVSPTPLREALRALAAEGLVVQQPQKVSRVAELSRDETIEIYALRLVLEPLALRVAMQRRPPQRADDIIRTCAELTATAAADPSNHEGYERAHRAFHRSLVADCGSATILGTLEGLWDRSMRVRYVAQRRAAERSDTAEAEFSSGHEQLRDACLGDDLDAAGHELNEHILAVVRRLLDDDELARVTRLREELPKLANAW